MFNERFRTNYNTFSNYAFEEAESPFNIQMVQTKQETYQTGTSPFEGALEEGSPFTNVEFTEAEDGSPEFSSCVLKARNSARSKYIPSVESPRISDIYRRLSKDPNAKRLINSKVDQEFSKITGFSGKLDPKKATDMPNIRIWLRIRDCVINDYLSKCTTNPTNVPSGITSEQWMALCSILSGRETSLPQQQEQELAYYLIQFIKVEVWEPHSGNWVLFGGIGTSEKVGNWVSLGRFNDLKKDDSKPFLTGRIDDRPGGLVALREIDHLYVSVKGISLGRFETWEPAIPKDITIGTDVILPFGPKVLEKVKKAEQWWDETSAYVKDKLGAFFPTTVLKPFHMAVTSKDLKADTINQNGNAVPAVYHGFPVGKLDYTIYWRATRLDCTKDSRCKLGGY